MPLMPAVDEWTYVTPITEDSTDKDKVRFWLQDTDPDVRLLADAEIQYLVDIWMPKVDSLIYVAAKAAEVISVKFAGVVSVSADGVNVAVADISGKYAQAAVLLEQLHRDAQIGEVDIANLMWGAHRDHGIDPLVFGMGLHDNREAGRQDYGGENFNPWAYAEEVVGYGR